MADFWKRLDEKSKTARIVVQATGAVINPIAGPVAQGQLTPPPTAQEQWQEIQLSEQEDWAAHRLRELQEQGRQLGQRQQSRDPERRRAERRTRKSLLET